MKRADENICPLYTFSGQHAPSLRLFVKNSPWQLVPLRFAYVRLANTFSPRCLLEGYDTSVSQIPNRTRGWLQWVVHSSRGLHAPVFASVIPSGKFGTAYLSQATAAAKAALPLPTRAWGIFVNCQEPLAQSKQEDHDTLVTGRRRGRIGQALQKGGNSITGPAIHWTAGERRERTEAENNMTQTSRGELKEAGRSWCTIDPSVKDGAARRR